MRGRGGSAPVTRGESGTPATVRRVAMLLAGECGGTRATASVRSAASVGGIGRAPASEEWGSRPSRQDGGRTASRGRGGAKTS